MMNWCKIGIHKYGKWQVQREGTIRQNYTRYIIGHFIEQRKVCENCGKIKLRTEEV